MANVEGGVMYEELEEAVSLVKGATFVTPGNYNLLRPNPNSTITFNRTVEGKKTWVIKLTEGKILLNREDFPDMAPDDFTKEFCRILEEVWSFKFTKREE